MMAFGTHEPERAEWLAALVVVAAMIGSGVLVAWLAVL